MPDPLTATEERPALASGSDEGIALVPVDRAIGELRRGGIVLLHDGGGSAALVASAETIGDAGLARLRLSSRGLPVLAVTARRGVRIGLAPQCSEGPLTRTLPPEVDAAALRRLADPTVLSVMPLPDVSVHGHLPPRFAECGIRLAKLSRLLPAVVMGLAPAPVGLELPGWAAARDLLTVRLRDVERYETAAAQSLKKVGDAVVPLHGAENARIVAFRPSDGGTEHLAIIIGAPPPDQPVLTRLHSECFTGDLLGSLRCDCGDQLRGAIEAIAAAGSGLLLYLAQEGRGIGLVNKLRAYALQDRGADTLEANEQLGFDGDERVYLPAAEMLRQLGFCGVRLMTNNPDKVEALARFGINVVERVPHAFPATGHNRQYLETKAARFGHLF